jgi:hypothetical protein
MPGWVDTPEEEKAWKKAKSVVAKQRSKKESDFTDRDWGLVTHIAKNVLKSSLSVSVPDETLFHLAKVERILGTRNKVVAKKEADDKLPEDAKAVVNALKKVMGQGGQAIAALRKAETTKMESEAAQALASELESVAAKLKEMLENVKG